MARDPEETQRKRARTGTLQGIGQFRDVAAEARASAMSAKGEAGQRIAESADATVADESSPGRDDAVQSGLHPGMIVAGKFALVRLVAQGGLAQVYEAEDTLVGRRVALKVLLPEHASSAEVVRRFRREAHATATVTHPNVVTVFEVGRRGDGSFYLVEELLVGPTLHDHRHAKGRLSEDEALGILAPVASALVAAHSLGVVHRDVKPSNIILSQALAGVAVPKLIDFGIARMHSNVGKGKTMIGTLLGTAQYMSPEQALGEPGIDGRTDVWALAVVLYEALTGVTPFDGPNQHVVLARVLSDNVEDIRKHAPLLRTRLVELIHGALQRDPAKRPSMRGMFEELSLLAGFPTVAARAPEPRKPLIAQTAADTERPSERMHVLELAEEAIEMDVEIDRDSEAPPPSHSAGPRAEARPGGAPAAEIEVELDVEPDDDEDEAHEASERVTAPPQRPAPRDEPVASEQWMRGTGQVSTDFTRAVAMTRDAPERALEAAQRALRINALEEAVHHAELGVVVGQATGELEGQLRLAQAIALHWLGEHQRSDEAAARAIEELDPESHGWFGAMGHSVLATGSLGRVGKLPAMTERLVKNLPEQLTAGHVIAISRFAIVLTRAGILGQARNLVRDVRDRMDRHAANEPAVYAWLDAAFAERSAFCGDPARELQRRISACERFTSAGDVRNSCRERTHLGAVLLRLGALEEAERTLGEQLAIAEPMKLHVAGTARAYLGFAAYRRGDSALAREHYDAALARAVESGDRYLEAIVRTHVALALAFEHEHERSLIEAETAVVVAGGFPALRARALAVAALAQLSLGGTALALESSREALRLLAVNGGAGEGESLLRLTHARALHKSGNLEEASVRIRQARHRIIALAERLGDPRHKQCFLDQVPENVRILKLSRATIEATAHEPQAP
ncbi:MAG: serine/threonine-protein kinase [Polyangiaceae bacterium]